MAAESFCLKSRTVLSLFANAIRCFLVEIENSVTYILAMRSVGTAEDETHLLSKLILKFDEL